MCQPIGDHAGKGVAAAQRERKPNPESQPSQAAALHSDTQRIAAAPEARNGYEQSAQGQKDADGETKSAADAAFWAMWLFFAGVAETAITGLGVYLVYRTLKEAQKSADAATQALELARRPRIHVRIVAGKFSETEITIIVGHTNRGEQTAYIHRLDCKLFYRERVSKRWFQRPVWEDIPGDATTITELQNGAFKEAPFPFEKPTGKLWQDVERGHTEMCVVGHIRYDDRRKITRRTGFIWSWSKLEQDFERVDDSRWSFED